MQNRPGDQGEFRQFPRGGEAGGKSCRTGGRGNKRGWEDTGKVEREHCAVGDTAVPGSQAQVAGGNQEGKEEEGQLQQEDEGWLLTVPAFWRRKLGFGYTAWVNTAGHISRKDRARI